MVGYSDPNYFSRIFKKYEGVKSQRVEIYVMVERIGNGDMSIQKANRRSYWFALIVCSGPFTVLAASGCVRRRMRRQAAWSRMSLEAYRLVFGFRILCYRAVDVERMCLRIRCKGAGGEVNVQNATGDVRDQISRLSISSENRWMSS